MLKVNLDSFKAIEQGVKPLYKVIVYFMEPETYTQDDYLIDVRGLNTSMSEGRYEIANTTITLKNREYYISRLLAKELPNNKLVEVYMTIAEQDVLVFRGVVSNNWQLTPEILTMSINA